ncbi:MarR family transcriptional regulator [Chlorobium limicola]
MEIKEAIIEVLKKEGKPMSAGQIADASGIDRKDVDKAMKTLKDEERIVSPKRCYWEPKL